MTLSTGYDSYAPSGLERRPASNTIAGMTPEDFTDLVRLCGAGDPTDREVAPPLYAPATPCAALNTPCAARMSGAEVAQEPVPHSQAAPDGAFRAPFGDLVRMRRPEGVLDGVALVRVSETVSKALADGRPVVALESTVFSRLGLPGPAGKQARRLAYHAIIDAGAVPALTAVLDGTARVGVDDDELPHVLAADRKVGERDLPVAVTQRWPAAATTVSASLALAAAAGIAVFATGGIGGVHRDYAETGDESADLVALARHAVVTVCAGAKSFLDLPRTLERLETLGVPVLGVHTDHGEFPAFWSRRSGLRVPHEVATAQEVAAVVRAARALGWKGGVLVVTPVPSSDEVPAAELAPVVEAALVDAAAAGVAGGAVTPFVIDRIAASAGGRTVAANLALVEHNAAVAAAIAAALSATTPCPGPEEVAGGAEG